MSFPGGSPDGDAMSAKGRWVDATRRASKKIGFGQGSFEDGGGLMPQTRRASKKIGFGQGSFEDELG